ncbi:Crp/Fnr family transcriptional regulator [Neobacillus sp. NPDC097160]|uniref:Crp/Fnr family transcriptional regulator n=1 Tax=Neobacillus sp. NPDC097160 TaxID=3364298 RepID=UPI00381BA805
MLILKPKQKNWTHYLKYGQRMFFKRNSIIFKEDSCGEEGFYFLQKGVVKIYTSAFAGKDQIIDIITEGQVFGEQTVDRQPYFSTARAFEDSVVYFLPYSTIKGLMKDDHELRLLFYHSLGKKIGLLLNNILIHSLPAEQLLARCILKIRKQYNNNRIPLTQQDLSKYTGLTRITIYKLFKKWENQYILVENKNITVLNPQGLKEIADIS